MTDSENDRPHPLDAETRDPATEEGVERPGRFVRFLKSPLGIATIIVAALILIVGVVLVIPTTRYAALGLVVKKDARVAIVDASTRKPLSDAKVDADGVVAVTNAKGVAMLRGLPVGPHRFTIEKRYYRSAAGTLTVPILSAAPTARERLTATGFPLQITATDRITGAAIAGASVEIGSSKATTGDDGIADVVLPAASAAQTGTVTRDGYNPQPVSVDVAQRPSDLSVSLTASGTLRYLSKATGVINVMEANLDGSGATVALAGTGSESDDSTTLLTTTDWKYSALLADRTGKRDALYLLTGGGKEPVTLDASTSFLTLIGWQDHTFFWQAEPIGPSSGSSTLQAFDADTGKKTTVDSSTSVPGAYDYFGTPYLQRGHLVYVRAWTGQTGSIPPASTTDLIDVDTATMSHKTVKSFPVTTYASLRPYAPERVYVRGDVGGSPVFYSYSYSALTPASISDDRFGSAFPTFLESPSDKRTLWAEARDGKNTIFIGDDDGGDPQQLATLSEYTPYGWYGADDRYILLTKNDSELYIAPAGVPLTTSNILKITDYHKPANSYPGYGSGYGG